MFGLKTLGTLVAGMLTAGLAAVAVQPAWSAENGMTIELNRVKAVKDACRMSFVFTNRMDIAVEALAIETVLFNKEQSVERFLVLKSRPLSPKKIRVQQFDVRGVACERFGKLLLNDVKECKAGNLTPAACLERIEPTSRSGVPFISTAASN